MNAKAKHTLTRKQAKLLSNLADGASEGTQAHDLVHGVVTSFVSLTHSKAHVAGAMLLQLSKRGLCYRKLFRRKGCFPLKFWYITELGLNVLLEYVATEAGHDFCTR